MLTQNKPTDTIRSDIRSDSLKAVALDTENRLRILEFGLVRALDRIADLEWQVQTLKEGKEINE